MKSVCTIDLCKPCVAPQVQLPCAAAPVMCAGMHAAVSPAMA
jgi:hypothetical protein